MSKRDSQSPGKGGTNVVGVKAVTVSVEAWNADSFLPGDILEQIKAGEWAIVAPFAGGRSGLQKELKKLVQSPTGVMVRVRRGGKAVDIQAKVLAEEPNLLKKQQYFLVAQDDLNYVCRLEDTTEEECKGVQGNTMLLLERAKVTRSGLARERLVEKLNSMKLTDSSVLYPWKVKMEAFSPVPGSGMVFSLLLMPYQPNKLTSNYMDVEESAARAMAWLTSAQATGVPIAFVNIQTEPFLLQGPGFKATGLLPQDPSNTANSGLYTVQAYDGLDIEIVRAIRLWYVPAAAELAVDLRPKEGESRLGVGIKRTEEGFCHVSSVDEGTAAHRAGLKSVYEAACLAGKLLVISRVGGVKVTPWMVASSGSIRCFETTTISKKLLLHRQACQPVQLHLMLWDGAFSSGQMAVDEPASSSEVVAPIVLEGSRPRDSSASASEESLPSDSASQFWFANEDSDPEKRSSRELSRVSRSTSGSRSFRSSRFSFIPKPQRTNSMDASGDKGFETSFRFEVPDGVASYRESSLSTPLISRPSSPVHKSL